MTTLSNSLVLTKSSPTHLSSGAHLKSLDQGIGSGGLTNLSFGQSRKQFRAARKALNVQAGYSDGRSNGGSLFVGGFVLGGIVVGTLGCIYASKITETLAGVDKKQIMKRLPKFIYDEEKDLEKKRRILEEKIEQLNATLDGVAPPRSRSRHDVDAEYDEFAI